MLELANEQMIYRVAAGGAGDAAAAGGAGEQSLVVVLSLADGEVRPRSRAPGTGWLARRRWTKRAARTRR